MESLHSYLLTKRAYATTLYIGSIRTYCIPAREDNGNCLVRNKFRSPINHHSDYFRVDVLPTIIDFISRTPSIDISGTVAHHFLYYGLRLQ